MASKPTPRSSSCSAKEEAAANTVKALHDLVEQIAYEALIEGIEGLGIKTDAITEKQSERLLYQVKLRAHQEMYKKGGYISSRGTLSNSQIQNLIAKVAKIVHDRDTKLTDARYHSVSELLLGLDDHNGLVKDILRSSWAKTSIQDPDHRHLDQIKASVNFYSRANKLLSFDLNQKLNERKLFWDTYFPGKRESTSNEDAQEFIRILEVRHHFGNPVKQSNKSIAFNTPDGKVSFSKKDSEKPLAADLPNKSFVFNPYRGPALARGVSVNKPALIPKEMTHREFLSKYYPDVTYPS